MAVCHSPFGNFKIMFNYYFNLTGLNILLQSPNPISVTTRFAPFTSDETENKDIIISITDCNTLPEIPESAIWQGLTCYSYTNNIQCIYHAEKPDSSPFAMTRFKENGDIELFVLKEFLHYFDNTSSIFNHINMENMLLQHNGMLLHASFIKYNNSAILFTGPSGIGKSTQADLWKKIMNAEIINGDRAAIRKSNSSWTAFGSPYSGTSKIYINDSAPVKALILLRQADENRIFSLSPAEALRFIYPEISSHKWDKFFVTKVTELFLNFVSDIPVFLLECLPNEDAVKLTQAKLLSLNN